MSKSLHLIKYELIEGELYEDQSTTIISAIVSSDLIEEIKKVSSLIEVEVFEEKGSSDAFKVDCINKNDLPQIYKRLEEIFMRMLQEGSEKSNDDGQLILSADEIGKLVYDFRLLTNIMYLLEIKTEKYPNDQGALIQIG